MTKYTISKETDTRNNSDLYVIRFENKVSNAEFNAIKEILLENKIYYSSFKKGFISKKEITDEFMQSVIFNVDETEEKETSPKQSKIVYNKFLSDYVTIDQLKDKIDEWAILKMKNPAWGIKQSIEEIKANLDVYIKDYKKDSYYNRLDFVREAIIHKSLGYDRETLYTNGSTFPYFAIWDLLPTIKGLKLTEKWYYSSWGYDQTNIDIAWVLNTRLFGLTILVEENQGKYLLKRISKDNTFNDGCRYFWEGKGNPKETRERDCSYTGQYR